MALPYILKIKGETLDDLGLDLVNQGQVFSGPAVSRDEIGIPGRLGAEPLSSAVGESGRLTLGLVLPSTPELRRAALDTFLGKMAGLVDIEFGDALDRVYWGRLDRKQIEARFPSVTWIPEDSGDYLLPFDFILSAGGASFAKSEATMGVSSTALQVTGLGALPSIPYFYFNVSTSNLVITVKHGLTREIVYQLTLSGTTAADEILEVGINPLTHERIISTWDNATGERVSRLSLYSSGAFPIFNPKHGDANNPPTVEVNSTHTGDVEYLGVHQ